MLALFEDATPLIIELKSANGNHFALSKAVCERLDSYKGTFCIESFDPFCVLDVKKLRPEICRGQLSMNFCKDPSGLPFYKRVIAGNMLLNFLTRPDFIAYKFEDRKALSPTLCRTLWGIQEVSWTIRQKEDLLNAEQAAPSAFSSALTRTSRNFSPASSFCFERATIVAAQGALLRQISPCRSN